MLTLNGSKYWIKKAKFQDKDVFGHIKECGNVAGMGSDDLLPAALAD